MKKLLIVSPHFPPINAPDMQRVRMSLPFYRAHGWEPVVLAVGERWQSGVRESALRATIPADVRIEWCRAVPLRWSRPLGFGTLGLRSWLQLRRRGSQLLRREKFDLVFFSNTQFITFTLGPIWRRRHGVPYVLDFQDPWRTDYYERTGSRRPPGGWKYQFARLQARLLERRCVEQAAGVISVSPAYLADLAAHYPRFARTPQAVLQFGASPADLAHAAAAAPPAYRFSRDAGEVHLLYTGASGPVMPHALNVLFQALRLYRESRPAGRRLRLHFIGTSYAPAGEGVPSVLPVAAACGVSDQVFEIAHRVGFLESIRLQQEADVLVLLGSSDLAYSPSKLYLYYLTQRPILGLVFQGSVMEQLLDDLACAYTVRFRELESKASAYAGLAQFFDAVLAGQSASTQPRRNEALFQARYLASELTRQQCVLFERALAAGS